MMENSQHFIFSPFYVLHFSKSSHRYPPKNIVLKFSYQPWRNFYSILYSMWFVSINGTNLDCLIYGWINTCCGGINSNLVQLNIISLLGCVKAWRGKFCVCFWISWNFIFPLSSYAKHLEFIAQHHLDIALFYLWNLCFLLHVQAHWEKQQKFALHSRSLQLSATILTIPFAVLWISSRLMKRFPNEICFALLQQRGVVCLFAIALGLFTSKKRWKFYYGNCIFIEASLVF